MFGRQEPNLGSRGIVRGRRRGLGNRCQLEALVGVNLDVTEDHTGGRRRAEGRDRRRMLGCSQRLERPGGSNLSG